MTETTMLSSQGYNMEVCYSWHQGKNVYFFFQNVLTYFTANAKPIFMIISICQFHVRASNSAMLRQGFEQWIFVRTAELAIQAKRHLQQIIRMCGRHERKKAGI